MLLYDNKSNQLIKNIFNKLFDMCEYGLVSSIFNHISGSLSSLFNMTLETSHTPAQLLEPAPNSSSNQTTTQVYSAGGWKVHDSVRP